tara:strand:- start:457 stop:993 length:537 start_codon:yes stop_codon:yes gene_type:complete
MPSKVEKEILHLAETLLNTKTHKHKHKHNSNQENNPEDFTDTQKFLLQSLENEKNHEIQKFSFQELQTHKEHVLSQLQLDKQLLKHFLKTLKDYRYVDELTDIREGCYSRWIPLNKNQITLTKGGILCEIKITNDNVILVFKNNMNRFFQCNMANVLLFQKLTDQEQIILYAMHVLQN